MRAQAERSGRERRGLRAGPQRALRRGISSLRSRLVLAVLTVELLALGVLLVYGARQLQRTLRDQVGAEAEQVVALLNQALAAPLAKRDVATIQQVLDAVRGSATRIDYLVLQDHRGRTMAATGWPVGEPLPARDGADISLDRADATLHLGAPVVVAGQALGRLDLGLSTLAMRDARSQFLSRGLAVGVGAMVLSTALLAAIALAITRRLARLDAASRRVAAGEFDVRLPVEPNDELGRLGASFNTMAAALKQRLEALHASEQRQREHLRGERDERERLTTLLAAMRQGILCADATGTVVYANAAFTQIWKLAHAPAGRSLADLWPLMAPLLQPGQLAALQMPAVLGAAPAGDGELHTVDGRILQQRVEAVGEGGCIWLHEDVTADRELQQRARQALIDPLTRLPNRRGLYETLHAALAQAARAQETVALMFIDLDDFKHANDLGGHLAGDRLLMGVAETLRSQTRQGEVVARLGGDEFAMICPGLLPEAAGAVAERLIRALGDVRLLAGRRAVRVGCSVGIAHYPADAVREDELIACADTAMYQAKEAGKGQWLHYRADQSRQRADAARVDWGHRIHAALEEGRLVLHYQPVLRTSDHRVAYHEALVRMVDADDAGRLLLPASFVPHAERSGRIRSIDRWVFGACVQRLAAEPGELVLAANLSARSLEDPDFAPFLGELLQGHDVDPRRLHIELTETTALAEPLRARHCIGQLRALGCSVHLDDYGAGFNSFAQLKLLDVDAVKIDGSIVRDLNTDLASRTFVTAIIEIARSQHKLTIAEHVENESTLNFLRAQGVDLVQGFHLGRPALQPTSGLISGPMARPAPAPIRLVGG